MTVAAYPTFGPKNELGYKVGNSAVFVPPWLADTVMIRPFGEYGSWTGGVYTRLNGGYWYNAQSGISDGTGNADIVNLVNNDLRSLPGVKKIVLAVHWYTSYDQNFPGSNNVVPAIGPEVQAWNWINAPPGEYSVYPWTRANAYYLLPTHQVWPTLDDSALINGIQYLQNSGYQVGLCPIVSLISRQYYYAGGGEWAIDRSLKVWHSSDQANFTNYLNAYTYMYEHYISLLYQHNITPWIMYLGYGMRDITGCAVPAFVNQFVQAIQALSQYSKAYLPHTLTTYAADLDEYYYSYEVRNNQNNLDPLWTCPTLDYVGINWMPPLVLNDTEDNKTLEKGILQGEGNTFYLPNSPWRDTYTDRRISNTTRNFKTGLGQTQINPLVSGVKNIIDWLSFYHYYPASSGVLAGCTPLVNLFPGDARLCTHIHGTGPVGSLQSLTPSVGGLAPIPDLKATWLQVQRHSYIYLTFPSSIPDNSVFNFQFTFAIDPTLTALSGNYRLFATTFGMYLDSIAGTITLGLQTIAGSYVIEPLFSATSGSISSISLVYTAASVQISVDGAFDFTVKAAVNHSFKMPAVSAFMWLGNYPNFPALAPGYGIWQGKIYFLSMIMGQLGGNQSGGQYFFDDTYCGIRTAWTPNLKPWMATAFGYGSVHGSAVDPQMRVQTFISPFTSAVPVWYEDYQGLSTATFRNSLRVWDIGGPYGSDYAIDDVYQAIVMNAAALGIIEAGAVHQVAWFFDTRNGGAYKALMPNGQQIFNDAYDYEINTALNGKAAVRDGGSALIYTLATTVSEDLGLSIVPGDLPYQKVILEEANVPQT